MRKIGLTRLVVWSVVVTATSGPAAAQPRPHSRELPDPVSARVHVFYYPWYANPSTDGYWSHWNHQILLQHGKGGPAYTPPDDIGSNFYPQLGLYSSQNPGQVGAQMRQMRDAGIGVVCISWWGPGSFMDQCVPVILKAAEQYGLKVNFHIEPYPNRTAASVRRDIAYIIDTYGGSPAFYRDAEHGNRPMFYLYDSYQVSAADWATVLTPAGATTIRGTKYDAVAIALWVKEHEESFMLEGGFDGFYTYFAVDGFVYGSTPAHWPHLREWASKHGKMFIPSVGPGYDDTRVRPWNAQNRRDRETGAYYDRMCQAAINARPDILSITSFNEWHEGTQIEPAVAKTGANYTYLNYAPKAPDYYLKRTAYWVARYRDSLQGGRSTRRQP